MADRLRWVALAFMLWCLLGTSRAEAYVTFYYSAPDNVYGWCSYGSADQADSCARRQCASQGGSACVRVLDCSGGWGAVALAAPPAVGIGATCGWDVAFAARLQALAQCMVRANGLCWTNTVFDPRARTRSAEENLEFDLAFLVQAMLQIRHFDVSSADGKAGPETEAAIRAFEAELDLIPTGTLDFRLFQTLLVAVAGGQNLAARFKAGVLDPNAGVANARAFAEAPLPYPPKTYTGQMLEMTVDQQRMAASILIASGSAGRCTQPAEEAALLGDPAGQTWQVRCREGDYTLMIGAQGETTVIPGGTGSDPEPEFNPETAEGDLGPLLRQRADAVLDLLRDQTYPGEIYGDEYLRGVEAEPSSGVLLFSVDDRAETAPVTVIVAASLVRLGSAFDTRLGWAVEFSCAPSCMTATSDTIDMVREKLTTGRADLLNRTEPRELFVLGCASEDDCENLRQQVQELLNLVVEAQQR